jgi:hypothetical protein
MVNPGAAHTLALLYARKAIEAERIAKGLPRYSRRDAEFKAHVLFTARKAELLERATQVIENNPAFAKLRSPKLPSDGQRRKRCLPSTNSVHNLSPK